MKRAAICAAIITALSACGAELADDFRDESEIGVATQAAKKSDLQSWGYTCSKLGSAGYVCEKCITTSQGEEKCWKFYCDLRGECEEDRTAIVGGNVYVWLEAEDALLGGPMTGGNSSRASKGHYVSTPNGAGTGGSAQLTFSVSEAGTYVVWGRELSSSPTDDSFYVSMDSGSSVALWDTRRDGWVWDQVSDRNGANPVTFELSAGTHTLSFLQREDGTKLDRVLITNNFAFVPMDLWIEAEEGALTAPMQIAHGVGASSSKLVYVPDGAGTGGLARYNFTAPTAGAYFVWGRALARSGTDDSFFASMDFDGETALWDTQQSTTWAWDRVSNRNVSDPVPYVLSDGNHFFDIAQREAGTMLDLLLITNDPGFTPADAPSGQVLAPLPTKG